MHFVLQTPSLQHLAAVKIVAHLWTLRDVFTHIPASFDPIHVAIRDKVPELRKLLTDRVESKVQALELPERYKRQLFGFIKPLGIEIIRFCQYYYGEGDSMQSLLFILVPKHLRWTMHGTIDYAKTAELMVKDELTPMSMQGRFQLACLNCLENEARVLFERIAENERQEYVDICSYDRRDDLSLLILFYTRSINLDVLHDSRSLYIESFYTKRLLKAALLSGNRAMCEYLFQRLNGGEKEQVFQECYKVLDRCRLQSPTLNLLYYLSLMNEEQRGRMFSNCTLHLLECLLEWPMQSLFVEAAKRGWRSMTNSQCSSALFNVIRKINRGCNDYDYSQLFWEGWRMNSAGYKQFYLNINGNLVCLLYTQREEFLRLILNEAPLRQLLTLCNIIFGLGDVLLDESVISEAALMECKETAALNSANDSEDVEKRLKSNHLTILVDHVMESRVKRREREGDSSDILHNLQQIFNNMSLEYLLIK